MADVAHGRARPHVRASPPFREIQQGQSALCRRALSQGSAAALWRARPQARGTRIRRRRLLHRRYRHLAMGLALRMANHRSQGVSQRDAVVHEHCQAAGGSEGLQSAEGRRRDSDTGLMTASGGSRGSLTRVSRHGGASCWLALSPRAERGGTSRLRQCHGAATLRWWVSAAAALVLSSAQPCKAQDTIDRPVTIYVAGTAGGGIDLYARLLGRHIGRHIPGKPTVTVQLMPGAGGIRAANYLAEQAPRDGTAMTTFASGPILEPLIGARNPGYDMSSFTWIGAITKDIGLCISWGPTPFKTIGDVKKQQMVVAGTGAGSETDTWPIVLNGGPGLAEVVPSRRMLSPPPRLNPCHPGISSPSSVAGRRKS